MRRKLTKSAPNTSDDKTFESDSASVPTKEGSSKKHKKGDAERARLRRNQRNSRARRREYVRHLEKKSQELDAATAEIQALRTMLRKCSCDEDIVNDNVDHAVSAAMDNQNVTSDVQSPHSKIQSPTSANCSYSRSPVDQLDTSLNLGLQTSSEQDGLCGVKGSNLEITCWSSSCSLNALGYPHSCGFFDLVGLGDAYISEKTAGRVCDDPDKILTSDFTLEPGALPTSSSLHMSNFRVNSNPDSRDTSESSSANSSPSNESDLSPENLPNDITQNMWFANDLDFANNGFPCLDSATHNNTLWC